jgi:hypothetical protein
MPIAGDIADYITILQALVYVYRVGTSRVRNALSEWINDANGDPGILRGAPLRDSLLPVLEKDLGRLDAQWVSIEFEHAVTMVKQSFHSELQTAFKNFLEGTGQLNYVPVLRAFSKSFNSRLMDLDVHRRFGLHRLDSIWLPARHTTRVLVRMLNLDYTSHLKIRRPLLVFWEMRYSGASEDFILAGGANTFREDEGCFHAYFYHGDAFSFQCSGALETRAAFEYLDVSNRIRCSGENFAALFRAMLNDYLGWVEAMKRDQGLARRRIKRLFN